MAKRKKSIDKSRITAKIFIDENGAEILIHIEGKCDLKECQKVFNNVIKKLTFKPSYERDVMFV